MTGRLHSVESFGTVDGPGIRYVIFLQGCPMRCLYCHNPDTWEKNGGREVTAEELLAEYRKNEAFYTRGGITVTGGEPLCQSEFVAELFCEAKKRGIHTCLDTSGILWKEQGDNSAIEAVLDNTDLVMLDIKHIDSDAHKALTGTPNDGILAFARYVSDRGIPLWIRHVVVRGYTDKPGALYRLGRFIGTLPTAKGLDVLPYHTLGEKKYDALGIPYPLSGVPATTKEEALTAKKQILAGVREGRGATEG